MTNKPLIYSIILVAALVQLRLIPHPPNFTPILAAGIFSGYYFKNFFMSLFIIILSMFLGDLYLGIHDTMFFTYISLIAVVAVGFYIKKFKSLEILFGGIISPSTTNAVTVQVQIIQPDSGVSYTWFLNRPHTRGGGVQDSNAASSLVLMEILA